MTKDVMVLMMMQPLQALDVKKLKLFTPILVVHGLLVAPRMSISATQRGNMTR